jgi:hypothetical protein
MRLDVLPLHLSPLLLAAANVPALAAPAPLQDNVHLGFESIIDFSRFAVRIPQADMARVPEILLAIPPERRQQLLAGTAAIWRRCDALHPIHFHRVVMAMHRRLALLKRACSAANAGLWMQATIYPPAGMYTQATAHTVWCSRK